MAEYASATVVLVHTDGSVIKQQAFELVDGHLPMHMVKEWAKCPLLQYDGGVMVGHDLAGLSYRTYADGAVVQMRGEVAGQCWVLVPWQRCLIDCSPPSLASCICVSMAAVHLCKHGCSR